MRDFFFNLLIIEFVYAKFMKLKDDTNVIICMGHSSVVHVLVGVYMCAALCTSLTVFV